jgi:hypothetical protein
MHDPERSHYGKGGRMSKERAFVIARSREKSCARLVFETGITPEQLEPEGARFGQWLLENGSTSFLRGLHDLFDEAEITKKIGLGY